jgi:hypothetical protein
MTEVHQQSLGLFFAVGEVISRRSDSKANRSILDDFICLRSKDIDIFEM